MNKIIETAKEFGFTAALPIKAADLNPSKEIRALCTPEKCPSYGTNWVCPPGCGSFVKCCETVNEYENGVLLQVRYEDVDTTDLKVCESLSKDFGARVISLRDKLISEYPALLTLSTGGCRECEKCTYPTEPCRKPGVHRGSLSAFGIDVGKLCEKYGVDFAFTEGVLYFTACMMIK